MIPTRLSAAHAGLAQKLRDASLHTLSDPMGDTALELGCACLATHYDLGRLYLQTIQLKGREKRPARLDPLIGEIRRLIVADAFEAPPAGLEDEMRGLVSPRFAGLAA